MTDRTDPKVLAELRELVGKATQGKLSLDGDVIEGPYQVARFFMYPHVREECEADRRLFLLLRNHAASLLADSERLGQLERYVGSQMLRSDFQTADEMRAALDRANERLRIAVEALEIYATCVTQPISKEYMSIDRVKEHARTTLAKIKEGTP